MFIPKSPSGFEFSCSCLTARGREWDAQRLEALRESKRLCLGNGQDLGAPGGSVPRPLALQTQIHAGRRRGLRQNQHVEQQSALA